MKPGLSSPSSLLEGRGHPAYSAPLVYHCSTISVAVDQPRPRPAQVRIAVERQDPSGARAASDLQDSIPSSSSIARCVFDEIEAARCNDDCLRVGCAIAVHSSRREFAPGLAKTGMPPASSIEFGNPMTGAHRRIGPLQNERSRTVVCVAPSGCAQRRNARLELSNDVTSSLRMIRNLTEKRNVCKARLAAKSARAK